MKKRKRLWAALLAALFVTGALPYTAFAAALITTNRLPDGWVGAAYTAALSAITTLDSNEPISWDVSDGLPDGLTLDSGTGVISGTPKTAGTFSLVVTAAGRELSSLSAKLPITIKEIDVTLDKTSLSLAPGGQETLTASVLPERVAGAVVTWASKEPGVAAVSDTGLVVAVSPGDTDITATATVSGHSVTASCRVTVTEPSVPPEPITLHIIAPSHGTLTVRRDDASGDVLADGDSLPDETTIWVSAIADPGWQVDGIEIAGRYVPGDSAPIFLTGNGICDISAKISRDPNYTPSLTGVTLDKTSLSLAPGGQETLTASVLPAGVAGVSVKWASKDPGVATVSDAGLVTAVSPGGTDITVTAEAGGTAVTEVCRVTVTEPAVPPAPITPHNSASGGGSGGSGGSTVGAPLIF